ncbi:MAG: putative phosphotriesterase [Herbinix sp.]|jgi:phosphotriesterase-related protein|nr:putative phosphotriesterase [Herbinix sp.]
MKKLVTTLGNLFMKQAGMILPHEHVFVDLRTSEQEGYAQAETTEVVKLMGPYLRAARNSGIGVIVDCGPVGVGRRADILKAVSIAVDYPLIIPTGVYREPWLPTWVKEADEKHLEEWMLAELTDGIEETKVQAGFVKVSAGDDGITENESKVLRAASKSAKKVDASIASHTIKGRVVKDQLTIIERAGYSAEHFIWVHTQAEPDFNLHLEMAKRGAWIEYDWIGSGADELYIEFILRMLDAGFGSRLLLSQDRGWFDPAQTMGGEPKSYTYLVNEFLPKLSAAGVDQDTIRILTQENPFRAFAR